MSRYDERVALVAPTACSAPRGRSSMVELQLPKLTARVRFPSPAPTERHSGYRDFRPAGKCQGGVFAVLGRFSGCGIRSCGAVEGPLTAADRSLGGVTQGLARCVEAESVKKCGLASKGSAPRQKVRPRALTDQPENGKIPRKARRPSLKNRVMLDLDQACAEVVLHPCWIICIRSIVAVQVTFCYPNMFRF